jgi:hypothetical protein
VEEWYFQRHFTVNVWCEVLGNHITEPHFIKGRHTATYYREFPQNDLPLYLEIVPLAVQGRMWTQQGGAPRHFSNEATAFLGDNYHGRLSGKSVPVSWPPRSPDLYLLIFFPWCCLKSKVYHNGKLETRQQLATNEADVGIRSELDHV